MDASKLEGRLKASKLFRGLDDAWIARLAGLSRVARFGENEPLWRAGADASAFTIIQRGLVQIVQPTAGGESSLLALFGPRESVGDSAVLERGRYPADAIAASEVVEVVRVQAEPVLAAMPREPQLAQAVNRALLDHTHALRAKIAVMSAGAVAQRVATLLLHLADRFGDEDEAGRITIAVPLSRGAMARLVGARVETVIRCVSAWQKQGFIDTTPDGFELTSLEPLRELAGGGS
ncbi:MAG: Crp/Fnr family transcriptional regulator [Polyangiaceae bacterium]|nr:Crp/Fnr family transcriptional regulator [Polyangiaceae bacterium]